ncbi:hypothetical protein CfE428DRAFT_4367 [Chthoniobacter flavus Ellin428]|uniref:Uncharacterized protein n=1 Tax=Chthoniobacter flavus Ellin428 TaxID=497964 RepID=B4D628_9BACT|nr:hypothetical protein [Chthoniobacter flavus]EDY18231.1 hypothetical protein CfE428DRAFT_4367 [Chthoniobacter flavus Ellin428]TCO91420.1 hypothetical protein EV701_108148 [Chthoniobacter flavus]
MQRAFLSLLVATLVFGGSAGARDIKTLSGDVFKNIEVRSKDATGIQIMHDDGVTFLDFKNMSEADQKDFGYNVETYAEGWKQKFEAERQRREAAELAAQQALARARALAAQNQANANASTPETYRPTNQTGLEVTVDSPGFTYDGYPVGGFVVPGFSTIIPGRMRGGVPYRNGYSGATIGPVEVRRR